MTNKEPIPGWTDNFLGPVGLLAGIGLGAIHAGLVEIDNLVDLVPCDMACKAVIVSAWEAAARKT